MIKINKTKQLERVKQEKIAKLNKPKKLEEYFDFSIQDDSQMLLNAISLLRADKLEFEANSAKIKKAKKKEELV